MSTKENKSRITILREMLGLSQMEFSQEAGITQGALSQLESGKSKLSLDSLRKISRSFQVNCNWLVNGQGDIFMKKKGVSTLDEVEETFQLQESTLIPLILEEARAGYIKGHKDTDYLSTLDVYKIPGFENGSYRLFEIHGDSMIPTIHPREIVVAEEADDWDAIEAGTLGVVITEDDIVAKRIYIYNEDDSALILKSDNADYKTYTVAKSDVYEIWLIRGKITNVFNSIEHTAASQLKTLAEDVEELKKQLNNLSKREN